MYDKVIDAGFKKELTKDFIEKYQGYYALTEDGVDYLVEPKAIGKYELDNKNFVLVARKGELPKEMEPMVYVNYCEKSELGNPRCQKLSDLDSKNVEQDKAWYADRDPNTNEPKTTAQMFFYSILC